MGLKPATWSAVSIIPKRMLEYLKRCIFIPRSIHGSLMTRYVGNWAETFNNEKRQGGGALLEVFFVSLGRWVGNRIKSERGDGGKWGLALMQVRKDQKRVEDGR